jgi:hypothetical protein
MSNERKGDILAHCECAATDSYLDNWNNVGLHKIAYNLSGAERSPNSSAPLQSTMAGLLPIDGPEFDSWQALIRFFLHY